MADFAFTFGEPRTEDEYRAAIDLVISEMKRLHAQSERFQSDIERISRETGIIQAQTNTIKSRTQARLDALEKLVPA